MEDITFMDILDRFKDAFPFVHVSNYRPICHEMFTDGKPGITIWLDNGDVIEYYPKLKDGEG